MGTRIQTMAENTSYAEWIKTVQEDRNAKANWRCNVSDQDRPLANAPRPPPFPHVTLFKSDLVETYAAQMTSKPTKAIQGVADATLESSHFAPCMVGSLESDFLKMMTLLSKAKNVLDVGTFTGMSAVAFAEAGADVITLENDEAIAKTANEIFQKVDLQDKIKLILGSAKEEMAAMVDQKKTFDIVFIDADKESYITYYELGLKLLNKDGFILVDNALCSLLYDENDFRSQKLHEFNQHVEQDQRTDQVVLTIREGITLIRPKNQD